MTPTEGAKRILSNVLDWLCSRKTSNNDIRDDQASLLVLACSTFRYVPEKVTGKQNMKKYLFYKQEVIHHARWMTKASGYLRLKVFDIFELDCEQITTLNSIVKFIIDVYVPSFIKIYLKPSAVQGPQNVIDIRDLLRGARDRTPLKVKQLYIKHAKTWVTPRTLALCFHDEDGPNTNPDRLPITEPNIEKLLWSNKSINSFISRSCLFSPCLERGDCDDWRSFKNNNMPTERLIGRIKDCVLKKKVADSLDSHSDESMSHIDENIRGYINNAYITIY